MQSQRILIVGTTSDYIDILRHKYPPKSLLFVTDPTIREKASEERPDQDEEMLCELESQIDIPQVVIKHLHRHIAIYGITLNGVACFDCESMPLAAHIAAEFALSYPSIDAVMACRDKSLTRKLWQVNKIPTPRYERVNSASQAVDFFHSVQGVNLLQNQRCTLSRKCLPCVLKPVDSSGSERVFRCNTADDCETAYEIICKPQQSPDIIIETFEEGTEYSCDFIVGGTSDCKQTKLTDDPKHENYDNIVIPIRFTRKIPAPVSVFGTTMAYEIVDFPFEPFKGCSNRDHLSSVISENALLSLLGRAAKALGITRSICMVDFIVSNNYVSNIIGDNVDCDENINCGDNSFYNRDMINNHRISLLEMAPRPGGDCLPWLIQKAMNIDILKLTLDFAGDKNFILHKPISDKSTVDKSTIDESSISAFNRPFRYEPLVGLRIHSGQAGVLKSIDTRIVESDSRVKEIFIKHKPGHRITLPPQNYDSWNLGHIIFKPFQEIPCKDQCIELLSMLKTEVV